MNILTYLYKTKTGRILLRPLISRPVSLLSGKLMDSRMSKVLIRPFARKNRIPLEDYRMEGIHSFNDFFCRRIREGLRPVSSGEKDLVAPCDGLLTPCRISGDTVLRVKQSSFSIRSLLRDRRLAESLEGGYCLVFRLCVQHYHRYVYFDSGYKHENRRIKGLYHTVRPVALSRYPVFIENTREYTVIDTDHFGKCVQMEVGAMLVGRIVNEAPGSCPVFRGEEKGHFEYGGSTIIVLLPQGKAALREDLVRLLDTEEEIPVKMGEKLGEAIDL